MTFSRTEASEKLALMAHGEGFSAHRHREGQLLYPSAGVIATTTEQGQAGAAPTRAGYWYGGPWLAITMLHAVKER